MSSPNSCVHKLTWEGSNPLLQMPQCHAYVTSIATIAFMHQTRYCCILFKDFMNNYYNDSSAYTCYDHMLQLVHLLAVMKLKPTTFAGMASSGPKFGHWWTVTLISQNPACSNDLEMRSFYNCNSKIPETLQCTKLGLV